MACLCRMNVTRDMCTGLSEILNCNEQSSPLLEAYAQTHTHTHTHTHQATDTMI